MEAIKAETIAGFSAYLDALEREAGGVVESTLLQFDSQSIDRRITALNSRTCSG